MKNVIIYLFKLALKPNMAMPRHVTGGCFATVIDQFKLTTRQEFIESLFA